MRKTVGIDLDSTLNMLDKSWINVYNSIYKDCLTSEQLISWDFHKYVKPECGEKIYDILRTPHIFRNLDVQPFAHIVTLWLVQYFDVYIVTAYSPEVVMDKVGWLGDYFSHIKRRNIMFVNDKGLVCTDYLIDDGLHNLKAFKGHSLVYDQPWNRKDPSGKPVTFDRFKSWLDIKAFFENVLLEGLR